eukprot:1032498-Pleurochrysis_carterae.AAC.1
MGSEMPRLISRVWLHVVQFLWADPVGSQFVGARSRFWMDSCCSKPCLRKDLEFGVSQAGSFGCAFTVNLCIQSARVCSQQ